MLAFRTTWYIKPGKMERAVEILLAEGNRFTEERKAKGINVAVEGRVFSPLYSPDALVLEMICDSFAVHEAYWAAYDGSTEEAQVFWMEWYEVIDHRGGLEVWTVHTGNN